MIGHEIITASAGAGKTWSLTVRYIRLLAMGAAPGSIIALTFSRRAAREFFTAILHRLAEAALDDDAAAALARDIGMPSMRRADFGRHLAGLVQEMPALTLGTLDSFFVRIARSFPLELGLTSDFAILDDHHRSIEQERVFSRVFTPGAFNAAGRREFILAFQQATWGKDEVRLKKLLNDFIKNWHGLFLQAPSGNVWGQPDSIWPGGRTLRVPDHTMLTLLSRARESMAALPELKDAQRDVFENLFAGLDTHTPGTPLSDDRKRFLAKLLDVLPDLCAGEATVTVARGKVTLRRPFSERLHDLVCRFVHDTITVCLHQTRGIHRLLSLYDRHYHALVRRQGRLTFQDIQLILSGDIATAAAGGDGLVEKRGIECAGRRSIDYRLDAHYNHWLLDEFQDTSRVQWRVLQNLCDEAIQDAEGTRSFFAVGDEKQSIFIWRGAEPGLFDEILWFYNQSVERIKVTPLALSQRSGPAVISMVNRLVGDVARLTELEKVAGGAARWPWQPHTSAHADRTGCGAVIEVPVNKDEAADETVWLVCADLLRQLQPLRRGLSCAVLCHRNARAAQIADVLRSRSGMEVVCESDVSIATDNPACTAFLALLKAAAHPGDQYSWQHVLMSPLGDVLADRWPEAGGRTLLARAHARRGRFTETVLRQVAVLGFERTLREWMDWLKQQHPALDSFSRGRLDDLCRAAQEYDAGGSRDIDEFVAFAESWNVRESGQSSAVQVMTLHKSKGLTFDIVILPDIHDSRMYPHVDRVGIGRGTDREIAWLTLLPSKDIAAAEPVIRAAMDDIHAGQWRERLAQLYVAVTRAKRANYILLPPPAKDAESTSLARIVRHMLGDGESQTLTIGERECSVISLDGTLDWIDAVPLKAASVAVLGEQLDLFGEGSAVSSASHGTEGTDGSDRTHGSLPAGANVLRRTLPSVGGLTLSGSITARHQSRRFGTLVHALFSRIEWLGRDSLPMLNRHFTRTFPSPEEWQSAALHAVRRCLADPAIKPALTRRSPGDVLWRERPFEAVIDGALVSGVFDRVTIEHDAGGQPVSAKLIEFKTDHLVDDTGAIRRAATHHSRQMQLYRAALQQITGLPADKVSAALVFTAVPRLILCQE